MAITEAMITCIDQLETSTDEKPLATDDILPTFIEIQNGLS